MPSEKQIRAGALALKKLINENPFTEYEDAARVVLTAAEQADPAPSARSGAVKEIALSLCDHMEMVANDIAQKPIEGMNATSLRQAAEEARAALEPAEPATDVEPVAWCVWREPDTLKEGKRLTFNRAYAEGCKDHPEWTAIPLFTHPPESRLREALEHVTELLVDTWNTKMEGDPERQIAVREARNALAQEDGR